MPPRRNSISFPLAVLSLALLASGAGAVDVLYVAPGASCGGASPCFGDIQSAVDAALPGDEIRVAAGTYSGASMAEVSGRTYYQVVLIQKSLTLAGGYTTGDWTTSDPEDNETIIDALGSGRGITVLGPGSPTVTIDGFTITGGDYEGLGNAADEANSECPRLGADCGGGLFAQLVTLHLRRSMVSGNTTGTASDSSDGAGAILWQTLPGTTVDHCQFFDNSAIVADSRGGALMLYDTSDVTVSFSLLAGNTAANGGAIAIVQPDGQVTIADSLFGGNRIYGEGGAIYASLNSAPGVLRLERTGFEDNGGAGTEGGVLLVRKSGLATSRLELENVVFAYGHLDSPHLYAAAVEVLSGGPLEISAKHVTWADQAGLAALRIEVYDEAADVAATLVNCLIDNAAQGFVINEASGEGSVHDTRTLTHDLPTKYLTEGGTPEFVGVEKLTGDPLLDSTWHINDGSAAIDAGTDAGVDRDFDRQHRPFDSLPDVGADEHGYLFTFDFEWGNFDGWWMVSGAS